MAQVTAERGLNDELSRKPHPSTSYFMRPGDKMRVYREASRAWDGTFIIIKKDRKVVKITDGTKAKDFTLSYVPPKNRRCVTRWRAESWKEFLIMQSTELKYSSLPNHDTAPIFWNTRCAPKSRDSRPVASFARSTAMKFKPEPTY